MNIVKGSKSKVSTVVLDTNVIVSSVVFGGKPEKIFTYCIDGGVKTYFSSFILFEVTDVLRNKFQFDEDRLTYIEKLMNKKFIKVHPQKIPHNTSDLSDNKILAVCGEVKVNYLITGDKKHLLPLKKYKKTLIISPETFLTSRSTT